MRSRIFARNEHGFTLIEILVVVAIIGILTAIAVPLYVTQQNKGKEASMKSDVINASSAMEQVFNRDGKYPSDQRTSAVPGPSQTIFQSLIKRSPGVTLAYYVYADEDDLTKTFYGPTNQVSTTAHPAFCIQSAHTSLPGLRWRWLSTERTLKPVGCPGKVMESNPAP